MGGGVVGVGGGWGGGVCCVVAPAVTEHALLPEGHAAFPQSRHFSLRVNGRRQTRHVSHCVADRVSSVCLSLPCKFVQIAFWFFNIFIV